MSDVQKQEPVTIAYYSRRSKFIRSYFTDIVEPAFETLGRKIERLKSGTEGWETFEIHDLKDVEYQTRLAFLLAIQSIWETQFRGFLVGLAKQRVPNDAALEKKIQMEKWPYLKDKFSEFTGTSFIDTISGLKLERLNYLGNYCRHGPGSAEVWLRREMPELWPKRYLPPLPGSSSTQHMIEIESSSPVIPMTILEDSVEAVAAFWQNFDKG